jgi:hypothetical protein
MFFGLVVKSKTETGGNRGYGGGGNDQCQMTKAQRNDQADLLRVVVKLMGDKNFFWLFLWGLKRLFFLKQKEDS